MPMIDMYSLEQKYLPKWARANNDNSPSPAEYFLAGTINGLKNIANTAYGLATTSGRMQADLEIMQAQATRPFGEKSDEEFKRASNDLDHMDVAKDIVTNMKASNAYIDKKVIPKRVHLVQASVPNAGRVNKFIYEVGNMTPAVAANFVPVIGQPLSAGVIGGQTLSENTLQASSQGASDEKALKYGTGTAALNGTIGLAFGGAGGVGKRILGREVSSLTSEIANPFVRKTLTLAARTEAQGVQNVAIGATEPVIRKQTFQPNAKYDYTLKQASGDYLDGLAIGGLFNGIEMGGRRLFRNEPSPFNPAEIKPAEKNYNDIMVSDSRYISDEEFPKAAKGWAEGNQG